MWYWKKMYRWFLFNLPKVSHPHSPSATRSLQRRYKGSFTLVARVFFSCLGATDWSIQFLYASRRCFAKDLWHPDKYNASFNKCKLRSLKLKTPYLGPDLPSMFLKLIIFPLLLLQEQSSNFVHTSRLDTLTARKASSKKTIDPSAMFCSQNREGTGEKFPGCEVMYDLYEHCVRTFIRLI